MKSLVLRATSTVVREYSVALTEDYLLSLREDLVKQMTRQEEIDTLPDFTTNEFTTNLQYHYDNPIKIHIKNWRGDESEVDLYDFMYEWLQEDAWDNPYEETSDECYDVEELWEEL